MGANRRFVARNWAHKPQIPVCKKRQMKRLSMIAVAAALAGFATAAVAQQNNTAPATSAQGQTATQPEPQGWAPPPSPYYCGYGPYGYAPYAYGPYAWGGPYGWGWGYPITAMAMARGMTAMATGATAAG